ncbi:subtilisin-like protein [Fomitopsis serialis]|uniref:subtilisin-like protein n=1 Tax=Fomitopsis serialis TaxID=139415 RepID=UPI002007DB1A|nr:subtilisin-like protein [Neoantrodia serialis]KAH9924575.1 subtilisin-like protein [Neoantrodia serialis]
MSLSTRLAALLALALCAAAIPAPVGHVVHEARDHLPRGWAPVRRAEPDMVLPFRVGLVQPNLESIEEYIMDVSHPDSPNYGKHWSPAKVASTFRPTKESVDTVHGWFTESGIAPERVKSSTGGSWMKVNVTIEEAERLLGTEYYVYQFGEDGSRTHVACHEKYHLPDHVSKHVEIVSPTLHFDTPPHGPAGSWHKLGGRDNETLNLDYPAHAVGQPGFGTSFPKTQGTVQNVINQLEHCDEQIVPDCLRALYDFEYYPLVPEKNSLAIVEYTPQAYNASDLDMFFGNFSPSQVGQRPVFNSIDGGYIQTNYGGYYYSAESNLDLQYSMALVGPRQPVQLYQAGDLSEGASFNTMLDALDASYCTFDGGDDPTYDPTYPDPYGDGYEGSENCGTVSPAHIISTSYSYTEVQSTPAYEQRQCAEYAKLGLMGVTVLYSSGDYGVAGNGEACLNASGQEDWFGHVFAPGFPAGCPYVTSVGATQVNPNSTVLEPESACAQMIQSGGGFSNVFRMPSYQASAVEHYLTNYPPDYPVGTFNASGSRAYPDISANGARYVITVQGEYYLVYGTSCATPVSAAIFSAINDARIAIGKSPIGFINPTIYTPAFMAAFNDITTGSNPGCGTEGFDAQPGWDPVTGVGTPNFVKLLALWLALP